LTSSEQRQRRRALKTYVDRLNRSLNGSISKDRLHAFPLATSGTALIANSSRIDPIGLQPRGLLLVAQDVRLRTKDGTWFASTTRYEYDYFLTPDASVASWHWHPGRRVDEPHIHVAAQHSSGLHLRKHHFPTGRVSLEDVLLFLLSDEVSTELVTGPNTPAARARAIALLKTERDRWRRDRTWS
jgi:hypothetical protein